MILLINLLLFFYIKLDYNIHLILLDLFAAFDTNDHSILIKSLEDIGIVGNPLVWIISTCKMYYIVRQVSVLGQLLFPLYISS